MISVHKMLRVYVKFFRIDILLLTVS